MAGSYFYGFEVQALGPQQELFDFCNQIKSAVPRATWTDPSKLHVTLRFAGKTAPALGLKELCERTEPFKLRMKGLGTFNGRSGPRVLFVCLQPEETLKELHGELGGIPASYTPHLTLAKLEEPGDAEPDFARLAQQDCTKDFGTALVDELRLYQTQGDGKPYRVVAWHRLIG